MEYFKFDKKRKKLTKKEYESIHEYNIEDNDAGYDRQ